MSKKPKKAKTPKAPKGKGGAGGGKDAITGNWIIEDKMSWTSTNGKVKDGLIRFAEDNREEVIRILSSGMPRGEADAQLLRIHTHEFFVDNNRNSIIDSGDKLIALGRSTYDGATIGGARGIFKWGRNGLEAFDESGLKVGNMSVIESGFI